MERAIKVGGVYRHFKGTLYCVIAVAEHTESGEKLVIYQAKEGGKVFARPLSMFLSPVDKAKYPTVTAAFRFEEVYP